MNIILLLIGLLNLGLLIYFLQRSDDTRPALREMLEDHEDHLTDQLDYRFEKERQASQIANQQLEIALTDRLTEMRVEIHQQTTALRAEMNEHFTKNRDKTDERMRQIQESNEVRLEQMRQTVEEKLEKTLQHRLQTSFETVSKQLESVNKGLGEMQTVARDVGTLNKVLSNTKTRGIMGELQLGQIIEDILTPAQYEREFVTVPQSSERVEYAIKLPGQGEEPVWKKLMNPERKRRSSVTARPFLLVSSVLLRISNKNTSFHQRRLISEFSFCQLKASIPKWFAIQNSSIACVGTNKF